MWLSWFLRIKCGCPGFSHLSAALRIVARGDPSWGYRLAGAYLRLRGWKANDKRVFRLWQLNGLSLPPYRPKRKIKTGTRLDGIALRRNDMWAWDFVHDRYHDSEPLRCLTVKDEATGFCLAIKTERSLQHQDVKMLLRELITRYGRPRAMPPAAELHGLAADPFATSW